jgi:hypothetical protein
MQTLIRVEKLYTWRFESPAYRMSGWGKQNQAIELMMIFKTPFKHGTAVA